MRTRCVLSSFLNLSVAGTVACVTLFWLGAGNAADCPDRGCAVFRFKIPIDGSCIGYSDDMAQGSVASTKIYAPTVKEKTSGPTHFLHTYDCGSTCTSSCNSGSPSTASGDLSNCTYYGSGSFQYQCTDE